MAINYELLNKGGISVSTNFNAIIDKPLDARQVVPSLEGLQNLIDNRGAFAGMIAYVSSEKRIYEVYEYDDNGTLKLNYKAHSYTEAELKEIIKAETFAAVDFKGAIGYLPSEAVKGDFYKISAAFTVNRDNDAEGTGFNTKVGDSIVSAGDEKWYLIPSGDDIEDTWRIITGVANNVGLTFINGNNTTADVKTTGEITFHHNELTEAPSDTATEEEKKTRTYLTAVEVDKYGHITGYKTATEDLSGCKEKRESEYSESGSATQTITSITQNQNGDVEVTYADIDFSSLDKAIYGYEDGPPSAEDRLTLISLKSAIDQLSGTSDGEDTPEDAPASLMEETAARIMADDALSARIGVPGKQAEGEEPVAASGVYEYIEANKYEHPTHTKYEEGFYKVSIDAEGHVSGAVPVTKEDIIEKIPAATTSTSGLMSTEDKAIVASISETLKNELNGLDIKLYGDIPPSTNRVTLTSLETKLNELPEDVSTSLSENNDFIANVASKLNGNNFNIYAVAFNANEGVGYMAPQVIIGDIFSLPECTFAPKTNCAFAGWKTSLEVDDVFQQGDSITLTGNTTFFAVWQPTDPEEEESPEDPIDPETPVDPEEPTETPSETPTDPETPEISPDDSTSDPDIDSGDGNAE